MTEKHEPCPMCGAKPVSRGKRHLAICHEPNCFFAHPLHNANFNIISSASVAYQIEAWNTRPAEDALKKELIEQAANYENTLCEYRNTIKEAVEQNDALKAEVEELQYIVEQFFDDWYCEDGCPKQKDKNFPCTGEEENETTAEFYPGECSFYQTKCWVEYYRWKYRQKLNSATPEKGGEDE